MIVPPPTITFLDRETLPPTVRLRPPAGPHRMVEYAATTPDELPARIAGADIVVTNKVRLGAEAIRGADRLKLIAIAATGSDGVDLAAARERGILVSNIRGYAVHAVPEHCFALILALRRNILAYRASLAAGRWQESGQFCYFDHPIRDLAGATLGIVGRGAIGDAVARLGEAFGMRILSAERPRAATVRAGYAPFEQVLAESDVISLHVPLTVDTRGLIDRAAFARMERAPLLINTARGGLVDEAALEEALVAGRIAGAGFDVAESEPPPPDSPLMRLAGRPDFILTPHVGWASVEATQRLADQLVDNIDAFLAGTPRNLL